MKYLSGLMLIFAGVASLTVSAQESVGLDKSACDALFLKVHSEMEKMGECWEDDDCLVVNFGCPWQEGVCHQTIASVEDQEQYGVVSGKIAEFQSDCMKYFPKMEAQCERYNAQQSVARCVPPKLTCLNGQCVTQAELLTQPLPPAEIEERLYKEGDPRAEIYKKIQAQGIELQPDEEILIVK